MEKFYKLTRPDGWDFYTGKTINYRDGIGKEVVCPGFKEDGSLCTSALIHASRKPDQCFVGAKIPCSAYLVKGVPIREDDEKCGFKSLIIIQELEPKKIFKWNYELAANPMKPFDIYPPKKMPISLLHKWASVWASVWNSVRASVWDSVSDSVEASVRDSVWDSVRDSVWDSVRDSVWDSVRDSVEASVRASVEDSLGAYMGFIFKDIIIKWKYIKHKPGEYPFQSCVDLWNMGLVPSYDGITWKLHGKPNGKILWKGKL